jgi:hypothetical protein
LVSLTTLNKAKNMPECKTEVSIKLNVIPPIVDLGNQVLFQITQNGIVIEAKLSAKSWRKAIKNSENFDQFLINIKGQLGRMTKDGFTLDNAGIAIFEKK